MEQTRKFKIIVNSKECGTCSGPTPSVVAKKVIKRMCRSSSKKVQFSLKECKRGCERVCGPYRGWMEKLTRPYKQGGKKIMHRVVCGMAQKMRGGALGNGGRNLDSNDFAFNPRNNENPPFFKSSRIGETQEQYIFFCPNIEFYKYVVIRKESTLFFKKNIIFHELELDNNQISIIDINQIDLPILLKLYEEITIKKKTNRDFIAKTIYDELDEYITNHFENNHAAFDSLFNITERNQLPIKFFSFNNKTQIIFFNRNDRDYYYEYVIIRDKNKNISFRKYKHAHSISPEQFTQEQNSLEILQNLLYNINELIGSREVPGDFATTIRDKINELLRNKIVQNSRHDSNLIIYFKIIEGGNKSPKPIKYITVGSKTSSMFGDKYQLIFFNVINRWHNFSYYQYVIIRDDKKTISLKEYDGNQNITNIIFDNFITDHNNFEILQNLLDNINELIRLQEVPDNFATTIRDKLSNILKTRMVQNFSINHNRPLNHNNKLIPYFNINERSNNQITIYEFGNRTFSIFGNKYQFIFFNIIDRDNSSHYYQYVIIRDNRQTISLKEYDGGNIVSDIIFDTILTHRDGYIILEKLYRDIILIRNTRESSNFATTIRRILGNYIYGDKLDPNLNPPNFLISDSRPCIKLEIINDTNYIFFCKREAFDKVIDLCIRGQNNTIELYNVFVNLYDYYMFVVFLNKNGINFYQLIKYKTTPLIIHIDHKIMSVPSMSKLLEYLYKEINLKCDILPNTDRNYNFYLKILYNLEEYILKILKIKRDLNLLKSIYFYIPDRESNNRKDFKINVINDKTYIFFYRCKGKRILLSPRAEDILYKYVIIIDYRNINFYKVKGNNDYSVFIRIIENINTETERELFNKIDRLLLGILYGYLLTELDSIDDTIINRHISKLIELFKSLNINEYYEFIKYFNDVLTSNIHGNLITINGRPINLTYNGTFDFDFLRNKRNNVIFQNILDKLLKMHNIRKNDSNHTKFLFKPQIKSILNNKLIMSNIELNMNHNNRGIHAENRNER